MTARAPSATARTLRRAVSALDPHPAPATSLEVDYDKRLMLFSGRANPELAARIAHKLGVDLGAVTLKTFSNGEVYCRYGSRSAAPTSSSSSRPAATRRTA